MEAVPRQSLILRLRILLALAALGWFCWVAYRTGFEEGFVFLAGVLCVALLLTNFARFAPALRWGLVVVLIGANVVAGLFFIGGSRLVQESRSAYVRALLEQTGQTLLRFHEKSGGLPAGSWKNMAQDVEKNQFWVGDIRWTEQGRADAKYVQHIPLRDPWGCQFVYRRLPGEEGFELSSSGPDRRFGTQDDIVVTIGKAPFGTPAEPQPAQK